MEPKLFVATKALIVYDGKVLILRESSRYQEGTNTNKYDVPGGRLTPGEHPAEALKREIFEETGLQVIIGDPLAIGEWRPVVHGESWQIVAIFFACTADSDQVVLGNDHDHFEWINPLDYERYPLIDNLKSVFTKYNSRSET